MNAASNSTLYVNEPGTTLGISKNTLVVKKSRKTLFSMPANHCQRVIIASRSVSISSDFVEVCSSHGIGIDFFDRSLKHPLAVLSSAKHAYAKMTNYQLNILNSPKQLQLAKEFLRAKTKNQINYLKYLNKYHSIFDEHILKMRYIQKKMLQHEGSADGLMGYEGQISNIYWSGLSTMLEGKAEFKNRTTKGATDIVNVSLNYGYAILYGRIHFHALKAGVSLHISFLHKPDHTKPTLVFDMIEEFRTFVVDRVIFRMFNQQERLAIDEDGRLDEYSKKRITKKVLERLASHTRYKNSNTEIDHIIAQQAYLLVRSFKGLSRYRAFVGRY